MNLSRLLCCILLLFVCLFSYQHEVLAQEEIRVPGQPLIIKHEPKRGIPFDLKTRQTFKNTGMVFKVVPDEELKRREKVRKSKKRRTPMYLRPIGQCAASTVRRKEVIHYSPGSDGMDFLFFDARDKNQIKKAEQSKLRAIGYRGGRNIDIMKPKSDSPLQLLAATLKVQCLPTRFRFVTIDNKRYAEHREGNEAWVEDTPAASQKETSE